MSVIAAQSNFEIGSRLHSSRLGKVRANDVVNGKTMSGSDPEGIFNANR